MKKSWAVAILIATILDGCASKAPGSDHGSATSGAVAGDGAAVETVDLNGEWVTLSFACNGEGQEDTVLVEHVGARLTGTRMIGDPCTPAGTLAFEATLPVPLTYSDVSSGVFDVTKHFPDASDPSGFVDVMGRLDFVSSDAMVMTVIPPAGLSMWRFARRGSILANGVDGDPSTVEQ